MRALPRLLPAAALLAVALAFLLSGRASDLSPAALLPALDHWRAVVAAHPAESLAAYVAGYAALTAAGLPVAMVLTIAGGALFGPVEGALAASTSATLAALLAYAAARSAVGPWAARRLAHGRGPLTAVIQTLSRRGFWSVLTARLLPIMPFALVNVASGLARVAVGPYVAATLLGGLPSSLIYARLGSAADGALRAPNLLEAARSPSVWGPLLALSVLAMLPLALSRGGPRADAGSRDNHQPSR